MLHDKGVFFSKAGGGIFLDQGKFIPIVTARSQPSCGGEETSTFSHRQAQLPIDPINQRQP
jgi:hypothetical protein